MGGRISLPRKTPCVCNVTLSSTKSPATKQNVICFFLMHEFLDDSTVMLIFLSIFSSAIVKSDNMEK